MKRIVALLIFCIMSISIIGCSQKAAPLIDLPNEDEIESIDVIMDGQTVNYSSDEWISQWVLAISNVQATGKESMQDAPNSDNVIQININCNDSVTKLFAYVEDGNYYIEQPYKGIYQTDKSSYETLTSVKLC